MIIIVFIIDLAYSAILFLLKMIAYLYENQQYNNYLIKKVLKILKVM